MKRLVVGTCMVALICLCFTGLVLANQSVQVGNAPSAVKMLDQDLSGIDIELNVGQIDFIPIMTQEGQFILIKINHMGRSFNIGEPNLPVAGKLITIPYGCELQTEIISYDVEEISLSDYNITDPIMPAQPSLSKSDDPADIPFEYNRAVYQTRGYYTLPLVETEILGTLRDMRLARVSLSPIEYNPTENKIRVYTNMSIRVNYINPDWEQTQAIKTKHYSPAFDVIYSRTINHEGFAGGPKNDSLDLRKYPIKFLIISDRMFEAQLQPFIEWKTKKGFIVITAYTDVIGTSNTVIKSYIQGLYNAGTPEDPAPSFVLFVGDAQQIAPFSGSAGSHITDLKFCEFTGDNLPEIYYGRFSAQNTTQLQPQIDKTLEYEQYLMPDPSYLEEVTLVSGVDSYYAITHGNGQINYGTNYYFNAAHGISPHVWLYPASASGGAGSDIIQTISDGVGLYNYTAHCGHTGHGNPSFTTSDIPGLTNYNQYLLGIGNCCSPNTFGTDYSTPCFGEAFLQVENKGGIGYIGGTNGTYWDEDYWWGVGYGAVVGAGPTYEQTTLGAYDGVFHDYGNPPVERHYVPNAAIIFAGNLGVSDGGSKVQYYWEIYHIMGDPSVMTYMGVPIANTVYHDATVLLTADIFTVQADPGSYVGLTVDGELHGAGYVDETGSVDITLVPFIAPATLDIIITGQNRIPYVSTAQIITPDGPFVIRDDHSIDDVLGNDDGIVNCGETIGLGVQLMNVGPDTAFNVIAVLSTLDTFVTITDDTENYDFIVGDFGIVNIAGAFTFEMYEFTPNEHVVSFELAVSGDDGADFDTTWTSNFTIPVSCYPDVDFTPADLVDSLFLGTSTIDTLTVINNGKAPLYITFSESDNWFDCDNDEKIIDPYGSLEMEVSINTVNLDYGNFIGYINYSCNDPVAPSGSVAIYLHIFSPDINLPITSIIEQVAYQGTASADFIVENNGPGPLEYSIARLMFDGKSGVTARQATHADPIGYRAVDAEKSPGETEPYFAGVTRGSGGPDMWGYSWVDSDDPDGPTYSWVDISTIGTAIDSIGDDDTTGVIPIGFDFPFYENYYNELYISSNGFMTFVTPSKVRTNTALPNEAVPNNLVSMWWDDLDPRHGGQIYYYHDAANERFIVSFVEIPNYLSPSGTGSLTFQAILYANGQLVFQYGTMDPGSDGAGLAGSTIGIENALGDDGLEVVFNAEYMHNDLAILFNAASWLSVVPAAGSLAPYTADTVSVNFEAGELGEGDYDGQLIVASNDPDTPEWNVPVTMSVVGSAPPGAPDLLTPADQAIDISQPVTLDWSDVSGADLYQVQIDSNSTFTTRFLDSSLTVSQVEVSGLDEGVTYYWRVRAHNVVDWGNWSQIRSFTTEVTWICGDVNGDGDINIFDVTHLISFLYQGGPPPPVTDAADVNNDGDVSIFDATYLISFLYKGGPAPNCP